MIENFDNFKKIYFIGIGGVAISAVARMFLSQNKKVFGSDLHGSHITEDLDNLGAEIYIGNNPNNFTDNIDLVIYTVAISADNSELQKAKQMNIPTISYPESLAVISKNKKTIAITGTHGKTTTTSMIAKAMKDNNFDPMVIVGTILKDWQSNFLSGTDEYFVVEGCEYKRSFLNLHPHILVIMNIEADHLDYYKDLEDIKSAFRELAERVPKDGAIICNMGDKNVREVVSGLQTNVIDFLQVDDKKFSLKVPGKYNIGNAKAAFSVLDFLGATSNEIKNSLNNFSGIWRRFEYIGDTSSSSQVFDDYAHHPTEIKALLSGVAEKYPEKNILAVFGPHMLSRTKDFLVDFANSFDLAKQVIVLPIYKARDEKVDNISSQDLVNLIKQKGQIADYAKDFDAAIDLIEKVVNKDYIVLTIGAGETNVLAEKLVKKNDSR